jgi:hypothetical protein
VGVEEGLAAAPDAETKGELLCNKALLLNRQGDNEGAAELLGKVDPRPQIDLFDRANGESRTGNANEGINVPKVCVQW